MNPLLALLGIILFVAVTFCIGFVINLVAYVIADRLGWFTKPIPPIKDRWYTPYLVRLEERFNGRERE